MIRDHIAANPGFERMTYRDVLMSRETGTPGVTDFDYAPFSQQGGLDKMHQLFGDELNVIIEELNEALAA